jgi:hypothetical protein
MIILISKRGSIRHHYGGIPLLPERPMIRPAKAGYPTRCGHSFRWNANVFLFGIGSETNLKRS